MFAAAHYNMSLQIDEKLYALLEYHCDIPMKWLQSAFAKLGQRVTQEIAAKGVAGGVRAACRVVGDIAGAAVLEWSSPVVNNKLHCYSARLHLSRVQHRQLWLKM